MAKFIALGGVWLDEIRVPGKTPLVDVPGGTVAFATFGACLFALPNNPSEVALVVKTGYDFPHALLDTFKEWRVDLHVLTKPDRPSARGRVHYGKSASERTFEPLTAALLTVPDDVAATGLVSASSFHFFDVPAAVERQVEELLTLRQESGLDAKPFVVWEPQVKSCSPATLDVHKALISSGKVNVFSPNHAELGKLCGSDLGQAAEFDKNEVERLVGELVSPASQGGSCGIIVRCAEYGCYVLPARQFKGSWLLAYHPAGSDKVVDPTGAGNSFLGGVAMGWLETGDLIKAAAYGSVAAGFAVERVGLMGLDGLDVRGRLTEFTERMVAL